MMHTKRMWSISDVSTAKELAAKLSDYTWTTCVDGAQEYAVVRACDGQQFESVTCGKSR